MDKHAREHLPKDAEFQKMYALLIACDPDESGRNATRAARVLSENCTYCIKDLLKWREEGILTLRGIGWKSYRVICRARDKARIALLLHARSIIINGKDISL